jgi:hypothetical protein
MNQPARDDEARFWELQQKTYESLGPTAWLRDRPVPHYVTNTPLLAETYHRLVMAFLEDFQDTVGSLVGESGERVTIIELGAGLGRFAFYFLRECLRHSDDRRIGRYLWRFVLTDVSSASVDFWQRHPQLAPFADLGVLDFARFDATRDTGCQLVRSGETLDPASSQQPLVVIANYVFDSLPIDAFRVRHGRLERGLLRFTEADLPCHSLEAANWRYDYEPTASGGATYPDDAELAALTDEYAAGVHEARFSIPIGGIRFLGRLARVAPGRTLVLVGDKGLYTLDDARAADDPATARHENVVSLRVNFHSVAQYVRRLGGTAFLPTAPSPHFAISVLLPGFAPERCRRVTRTYRDTVDTFGPADTLPFLQTAPPSGEASPVDLFLSMLRMTRDDPEVVARMGQSVANALGQLSKSQRRRLESALQRVADNVFAAGSAEARVLRVLARLEYGLQNFSDALKLLARALALDDSAKRPMTLFNIALCHSALGQWRQAECCLSEAAGLNPTDEVTQRLLAQVRSRLVCD